ncbi:hypothetical protein BTO22_07130 [Aliivibrio sifiae]|jgi:hypothetical protein|uniref:Uncharacterized protein n=1 Tax=Aliivibrio sifiae TaxID=566293 RepID=A0A2S7XDD2_9GAMM|nr:hypothetical protein BTO22_07130 [Aliivibrio sifiae]PQJ93278.1 hypothetical protein BTO23_04070 [Aliivibrio sifiae]
MKEKSNLTRRCNQIISIILLPQVLHRMWIEFNDGVVTNLDYIYLLLLAWIIQAFISPFLFRKEIE